ncbi:hypothetical protein [Streptomyces sp. GC420]|uniref:hypothetical protein n=1 Tax=Streptomyces sp. GC420 TaxID=2697568 RepID=UPI001415097C|nr:hypothetical protein [Streptomyces sp. GC420]NBM20335.1 hypothetical protein [Streptomyces sp. GC420]
MEQLSAGQKLDQAFERIGEKRSLSLEIDLDTDAETLKALDAASDPAPGEEIPDEAAKLLSDAVITFTVESKKPFAEADENDFTGMAMKVSTSDGDLAEYRVVGDYTYFRSDFETLSEAMGIPMPPADELPPEAAPLKKVIEGEWVKVDTKELEKAGTGAADDEGSPAAEPSLDAKTQKKLLNGLREVVSREVDLKTAGEKDGTEHITATAPFRTLLTELLDEIRPLSKDLPPGMVLPTAKDLKDAPNAEVTADFALKNGELTEVNVDLAALAEDTEVKKLGLVLRMSEGSRPTAPSGATELDMGALMEGFAGMAMGGADFSEEGFPGEEFPEDGFDFEELPEDETV